MDKARTSITAKILLDIAILVPLVGLSFGIVALIARGLFPGTDKTTGDSTPTATPSELITKAPTDEPEATPDPMITQEIESSLAPLANAHNTFGLNIFKSLIKENKDADKNVVVSPTSLSIAFTMLYDGANGDTQKLLAKELGFDTDSTRDEIAQNTRRLMDSLEDSSVTLQVANSLWIRKDFPVLQDYIERSKRYFDSEVTNLNFGAPDAAERINKWVNDNTHGKIKGIISPPIPSDFMVFLINAVYFKGTWTHTFDKDLTKKDDFYLRNGDTVSTDFMYQSRSDYMYFENDKFASVRLPYEKDKRFAMSVFVPEDNASVDEIVEMLTPSTWRTWQESYQRRKGTVAIPKFKSSYSEDLVSALESLGLADLFTGRADLSRISAKSLQVGSVKHKTFIEVDEEGTEAAAVTAIDMGVTSMSPDTDPGFFLIANRPFLLAISDTKTGEILFIGVINAPKS